MTPERPPIFRLLLLALLLGAGIQLVLVVVLSWSVSVATQFGGGRDRYESFSVLSDGTPVIVSRSISDYYDHRGRTLDGKPVSRERLDRMNYGGSLGSLKRPPRKFGRVNWNDRIVAFSDYRQPAKYWHFIHTGRRDGHGYFEGFDSKTKLRVGYIGRNGPSPTKPSPEECFVYSGDLKSRGGQQTYDYHFGYSSFYSADLLEGYLPPWTAYLVSGKELLEVDVREQTVRKVAEFDGPFTIAICQQATPEDEKDNFAKRSRSFAERPWSREHLVIRTVDRIMRLDPRPDDPRVDAEVDYEIPAGARGSGFVFSQLADGSGILYATRRSEGGVQPVDVFWLDETGEVVRDAHLELVAQTGPDTDIRWVTAGMGLMVPVPAVWTVASLGVVPLVHVYSGKEPDYLAGLARSLWESWPGLLISLVAAGVGVWWCLKRQQQYAAGRTRTWVAFVAVLGLPAFLGYLLHRHWPVRVECPACHERAPRDRLSCSACEADFPEPAAEGIEVFA